MGAAIEWGVLFVFFFFFIFFVGVVFVFVVEVDPPVLHVTLKEGSGEHYHEGGMLHVVSSEYFGVGDAVAYEALDVVMGTFEVFGFVHENRLHLIDGREPIMGVCAGGSLVRGPLVIVGSGKGEPVCAQSGSL